MNTTKLSLLLLLVALALVISACQQSPQSQTSQLDKLTEIQERGTLAVAIDPAYPPQSEIMPGATRASDTLCAVDQLTTSELQGFDVEVAAEIAKRLGVEACFVTPDWMQIIRGNWQGQWDISVGSMAITPERMETLSFTQPYYATPATFFVYSDNSSYSNPSDLSGKKIGVCSGCTYQFYLEGSLSLPSQEIDFTVKDAEIIDYATEAMALQELAWGDGVKLDAVLIASPTGKMAISNGLVIKQLGNPVYTEYLAAAVDKYQINDPTSFVDKVTEIIQQMHIDGTLRNLSMQYYGEDLTMAAAKFDISLLK
jgi:polar amino acid transport system substrate-binding protein